MKWPWQRKADETVDAVKEEVHSEELLRADVRRRQAETEARLNAVIAQAQVVRRANGA